MFLRPYAANPARAVGQGILDVSVLVWAVTWIVLGTVVHRLIMGFVEVGRQVESGADSIAGGLDDAGERIGGIPLIGEEVGSPLLDAGESARRLAEAGQGLQVQATVLAWVLALAVALPPVLTVVVPWVALRLRFAHRAATVARLAGSPGGERLLALRALARRPLGQVVQVGADPLAALLAGDADTTRRLAELERRAVGLGR